MADRDVALAELETQDEPVTSLPEHAGGTKQETRDDLYAQAETEGVEEGIIAELEAKPDLTIEDLRRIPGAEGMSDEKIKAGWDKAQAEAARLAAGGKPGEAGTDEFKLPFPVYDAQGNKIDALDKISLRDLFEGKLQVGYQALGKEQRKTLTEALRNASQGHWNEQKYTTTLQERNTMAQQVAELQKQVSGFGDQRKVWDSALTALAMGNAEPMKKLAQAYQTALTQMPTATPGMVSITDVQAEQRKVEAGWQFINDTINPAAMDIAKRYDADPKEVVGAIRYFIEREPPQFLTKEKIESILNYEVPMAFEANGYTANGAERATASPAAPDKITTLEQTVAALQKRIADGANQSTQQVRDKGKKAPPVGGGSTPGAGDSMPSFKSRSQMQAWLRNDPDWSKA
jgi:hypothetical protein